MNKLIAIALTVSCTALSGCLWICRVPFPVSESFSDEGECTNRVWRSMVSDVRMKNKECELNNYYPTICMRVVCTKSWLAPIDKDKTGEDLYREKWFKRLGWIPLSVIWLTSPVDAVVDTLFVPYDYFQMND